MLEVRRYGEGGPLVIVLHGGPGAPGSAGRLARGLAGCCRVLEPWQRRRGEQALSVARHVADLNEVIDSTGEAPALVGHSWGAMLGLVYAAKHPDKLTRLALVGGGTWDAAARARIGESLAARTTPELQAQLDRLETDYPDAGQRLDRFYELTSSLYHYDPLPREQADAPPFDFVGHQETWDDLVRLQQDGVYPAAFTAITCPVLMLHGAYDPHPGVLIRDSLLPHVPQLAYHGWERCGHEPWAERQVADDFYTVLCGWLTG